MKKLVLAMWVLVVSQSAMAFEVEKCNWKGTLTEVVHPVQENVRMFYNDKVAIYNVDYMEPVSCSSGLAVVMPDPKAELEGMRKCLEVSCFSHIDIKAAKTSYDPKKGLLITAPYSDYNPEVGSVPAKHPVKLRLNLQKGTVVVESANR